jgi:chitinase
MTAHPRTSTAPRLLALLFVFLGACTSAEPTTPPVACTADCTPKPPADTTPTPPPPPPPTPSGTRWVSAYYVGYQRDLYPVASIDFSLMTHIIVGRLKPNEDGTLAKDFDIDDVNGPAMARAVSQRAHAAGRKAILMLGGDGEHAGFVGAASSANRATFVRNLIAAMDDYGYDGLDVDWEPMPDADKAPLLALLRDLRAARPSIILTIPVGYQSLNFPDADAWYVDAAAVVNQMNLMTYGMADAWPGWVTWHSSALHDAQPNHPTAIDQSISVYRAAGVPANKLGIGVGFYGSCWRGTTAPRQATGSGVVASDNAMSYANIMAQYYEAGARNWDAAAEVPYLSFATAKGPQRCNFVSYDDEQSVAAKGAWAKSSGLGGAMIWTVAQGHIPTAPAGQQDPLLKALYNSVAP